MTKIINVKHSKCDVFIGRPSPWGNPFRRGIDGDKKEVIRKFLEWLPQQKELMDNLESLRGQRLGCYCKPKFCHGDVYLYLLGESDEIIEYLEDNE